MKLVVFGLAATGSGDRTHASLWRGLAGALAEEGHHVTFFERESASGTSRPRRVAGVEVVVFRAWDEVRSRAKRELAAADAGMVTSCCPDGLAATDLLTGAPCLRVFYDLDPSITLHELSHPRKISYIGPRGLSDFDLVLSVTGGGALEELRSRLGARQVAALYRGVDPSIRASDERPPPPACDLSFFGDHDGEALGDLRDVLVAAATRRPDARFLVADLGRDVPRNWSPVEVRGRLTPEEREHWLRASRLTLDFVPPAVREMGYCPSASLLHAVSAGVPVLTHRWEGLDCFFEPHTEILTFSNDRDLLAALDLPDEHLRRMAQAAWERAVAEHTPKRRANQLVTLLRHARSELLAGTG